MPAAIPLALDAFAVAEGMGAVGMLAEGTITAASVLGGMAAAGGALNAIGIVTGDKHLATIGGLIGAVGGIGSLGLNLASAGAAANATDIATGYDAGVADTVSGAPPDPVAEVNAAANPEAAVTEAAKPGLIQGAASTDTAALASNQVNSLNPADAAQGAAPEGGNIAASGAPPDAAAAGKPVGADPVTNTSTPAPQAAAAPAGPPEAQVTRSGFGGAGPGGDPAVASPAPQDKGILGKVMDMMGGKAKDMSVGQLMGMQALQGAGNYLGQQQAAQDAMNRQKAYQDWVRQNYSDSIRNLTIPQIKYTRPVSAPSGLIAGATGR